MRCHYRIFNTCNIRETIDSFACGPYVSSFWPIWVHFVGWCVAFVTGHLFTFLVVLSLICLVTTQILICENQTIWSLEILLRTIVAALLKTKCNGRFVKNKIYQETGKEYFTIVQMIVKHEGYKYFAARATFDAWSCPHTRQQKGHCLPDDLCPSHLQTTKLISVSHHDKCTSFLITQLPKKKRKFFP